MEQADKDRLIRSLYYKNDGFKSIYNTYRDAKEQEPSITMKDVKAWMSANVEKNRKDIKGYNSFVAQEPHQEYQFDIFEIRPGFLKMQTDQYGLAVIDIFSKYAHVVPMKTKHGKVLMSALLKSFEALGKQPDMLYSDREGAATDKELHAAFDEMGIHYQTTQSHAHFVERFIRTFRGMLKKRIDASLPNRPGPWVVPKWGLYCNDVLKAYNNSVHSATNMTPVDARKKINLMDAKVSMELKAKRGRRYPELNEGDRVRVMRKKGLGEKETASAFQKDVFVVNSISQNLGQDFYRLNNGREYIRADLVKV